ncbi:MAG TPA: TIGR03620 family F420-dependent LLM class oxidoreductase [Gaiellaceae bacterium]|nr:TIGR03620 family F420-dependent LLM class oxidoreductase [Gaiellaceae bacterium]
MRIGVWSSVLVQPSLEQTREALARVEAAGYSSVWFPERPVGTEAVSEAAVLLAASERLGVGTGIASIWARDATAAANAARTLNAAFGGRLRLGLGVSHAPAVAMRGHDYDRPLTAMRRYLDAMDAADEVAGGRGAPRLLAALAPRMLELARDRADGAHTYFVPVEHTAYARERLGGDRELVVEQVVLERDPVRARELARTHTHRYLELPNYRNNLIRLGFSEADLEGGGSDELVDRVVPWGSDEAVAEALRAQHEAGATEVLVQVIVDDPRRLPVEELERLAAALA